MFFWQNSMLHAGKGNLTSPEIVNTMKQSRKHNLAGGKKKSIAISNGFFPWIRADSIHFSHPSDSISVFYVFSMFFPMIFQLSPATSRLKASICWAPKTLITASWGNHEEMMWGYNQQYDMVMMWIWYGDDADMSKNVGNHPMSTCLLSLSPLKCQSWVFFAPFLGKPIFISRFSLRGNPSNWSASSYMCWHYGFYRR